MIHSDLISFKCTSFQKKKKNEISYPSSFFSINLRYNLQFKYSASVCAITTEDLKKFLNFTRSGNLYEQSKKKNSLIRKNSSRIIPRDNDHRCNFLKERIINQHRPIFVGLSRKILSNFSHFTCRMINILI